FTYTIIDAAGLTSSAQITVTIDGRNDAPQAQDDTGEATESGGLLNATAGSNAIGNVLSNDQDVDSLANGETRTVVGTAAGSGATPGVNAGAAVAGNFGTITLQANGSYVYVIDETNTAVQALRLTTQTLTDIFTYRMTDAAGLESTAEVTITLRGANDAPTAFVDQGIAVEAGGVANGSAGSNASGNVLSNDGDVDSVANGESKTVVGVTAGVQASANTNVGATVTGNYGTIQIAADGSYTYAVNNTHAAVQALRTAADTLSDVFTYSMTDAAGLISTTQVTITIQGANDAPHDLAAVGLNTNENTATGTAIGSISQSDIDSGDSPSYSLIDDAAGRFAIDPNTGVVTVADGSLLNFEVSPSHTITVRVTDSGGATYDETFTISLNDVNEFSVSVPTDVDAAANSVAENAAIGTAVGVTASAIDADGGTNVVSYALSDDDGGRFAINSSTGVVTLAGALDRETDGATRSITVRATSLDGSTADQVFSINIHDVDEYDVGAISDIAPLPNAVNENSPTGTLVGLHLQAVDLDATNSTITYSLDDSAAGRFQIDPTTGVVTTVGSLDFESTSAHSITVRATSADGSFITANFVVAINNVNERPVAFTEQFTTSSSTPLNISGPGLLGNDTDPESNGLSAVLVSGPATGTLTLLADGSFSYTPLVSFAGDVTFQYMASDGSLTSIVQTVTITVTLPAAPAEGTGGSGSSGSTTDGSGSSSGSGTSSSGNSSNTPDESAGEASVASTVPVVGAIDSTSFQSRISQAVKASNEQASSSAEGSEDRTGALVFNSDGQAFWSSSFGEQNSILSNTLLLSESHSAVARLNAEQDARLAQSLAVNVNVISHLQDELRDNSQVAAIEGAKFIAKTAIGSGVVVWVLHVSQVVAAVLAASSAWAHIDPLSILNASKGIPDGKVTDVAEALFDNDTVKK
ncbi:MAG: cadherin domain-containing protein, partial [Pirellulaceae bacterium]|nr:cadherin domain-containing protein [Pirellulaceae bacterium]